MTLHYYENESLQYYKKELRKNFPGIDSPCADINTRSEQLTAINEKVKERRIQIESERLSRIANYKAKL